MSNPNYPNVINPTFKSANRTITAITKANPALVTTAIPHNYVTGIIVRLFFPFEVLRDNTGAVMAGFGMIQANGLFAPITVTSPTQFTIAIDTTSFDPFVIPPNRVYPSGPSAPLQYPQVIPIGDVPSQVYSAFQNVLTPVPGGL